MISFTPRRTYDFMGKRSLWIAISVFAMIAACAIVWMRGINWGIDFLGGAKLTYHLSAEATEGAIQETLTAAHLEAQVQRFGEVREQRFLIKVKAGETQNTEVVAQITAQLTERFGSETQLEAQESVGPRVGKELRTRGIKIILYVLAALLVYIGFRFDFFFAPGALVALAHDLILTVGALVIAGTEFNLTILAALLTILGYSINDTIIIYDRIREHGKEITPDTVAAVINRSLTETLPRTILTSVTVLIAVVCLFLLARGEIRDFAYAFIVGIVTGTYSSIFIASPIYMWLYHRAGTKRADGPNRHQSVVSR
ncbi:MAG: protein translocase subunit SecF [Deltaproteobacteria bacterium]|nr:protein translocase subunit SecF [Deltaproteobacteria bacterium]